MTITYGLDISNHQGNMTSTGGVAAKFLISKLTEGTNYIDRYAQANLAWAKGQGIMLLGGYHYIRAGDGAAQARFFVARARELFGADLRGRLWQLDCEADASLAVIEVFKDEWDRLTGSTPILFYTGDWWLQPRGWNVAAHGFAGLWASPNRGYVGRANNVQAYDWVAGYGGFERLTILQYDARSAIGDVNQYQGTLAQLKALVTGTKPAEKEETMKLVYTSVSCTRETPLKLGGVTQINWNQENTDPSGQHEDTTKARPQGYPGLVPAFTAYVEGTVMLDFDGLVPGDKVTTRLAKNEWDSKANKITSTAFETLDIRYAGGDELGFTVPLMAYAHAGQHWYIQVIVEPAKAGERPAPTILGGTWRTKQVKP